ncbi:MAG: pantoate--beta-alanine ligase, partial [Flavobacteriales bacterium]|nr:pantoate--beta-alanine ligase [Flavobacteriales bacterium]
MVFRTAESLQEQIKNLGGNKKVGFIPTMGALHHGHISLVDKAFEYAEIVVVSIFVNPKQFNKEEDLKEYPRNIEADVALLKTAGEVLVFAPSVDEVYPSDYENISLELGSIATIMEGKYREGHFDGVINVVKRLFDIVKPDFSFFGLKDFQQLS